MPATDPWAQYETKAIPSDPAAPEIPPDVRQYLQHEGFLESAWNSLKSAPAFVANYLSGKDRKLAKQQHEYMEYLEKNGTPQQKRDFAKQMIVQDIPFASTLYKAYKGNYAGAAGDVAGLAPYALLDEGVRSGVGKVAKAVGPELPGAKIVSRIKGRLSPPTEEEAPPQPPYKAKPGVQKNLRYGGPAEAEYSKPGSATAPKVKPSERAARQNAPTEEEAPKAPPGFKKNPNIQKTLRYGGPKQEEYSKPTGIGKSGSSSSSESAKTDYLQHLKDRGPLPPAAQAEHLARWMKSQGWTKETVASMGAADWKLAAHAAGLAEPTPEVIQAARGQLSWRPSPRGTLRGPQ